MGGENDSAEGPADKDRWMRERTGGDAGARKGGGLVLHERLVDALQGKKGRERNLL